jgi:hypothetical protein
MRDFAVRRMWFVLWVAGFLALGMSAQTLDLARFPSVERVLAEPGDDAEHGATLKVLSEAAQMAGPNGQALFGAYYNALNDIDFRLRNGDPAAYSAFSERLRERLGEHDFRAAVRARFGLDGAAPTAADDGDELDRALRASIPYWITALCVLLSASALLVFLLDRRHLAGPARGHDSLPDELRTVRVLGRSYEVEARSGTLVEKESRIEERLHVHTTGGAVTVSGDQVSVTPTQVHAHTEITRKDCLWVRDSTGREHAWNFTNAALQARAGHRLSALARPATDGTAEFLLAYNHATGQFDTFDGLARAHQPRRLVAWLATTVVAAAAILLAMRAVVDPTGANVPLGAMYQLSNWSAPLLVAGVAAAISVPVSAGVLRGLRTRVFLAREAPAFRKHFETPTEI